MEDLNLNKEEKLKHELRTTLEKAYPGLDFSISELTLDFKRFDGYHPDCAIFNLKINTQCSETVDVINLTNVPIKQSTVKQLKKDQQKHGYKELTTMVADVLEKHYENETNI
ncbi:hypothetical protein [Lactobacillus paragasseri]|uniref:Uncharacterized protein n=1 Tax=Lactobacillus paragasseri TaxID=2107999 RepID=A0ABD4ZYZ5_9LACO|nr:hypothetical protein [Lactobacillus paragasseri]MDK7952085.1 hypothetical protein [Lactobacillus paragasseri]MDO6360739.1 hypothetical protein [Lactobacillus paragasseri]MDX5059244.1 hypothetical protein [Lactobacillus paragasseri]